MKFMSACLAAATLLVVAAPYNLLAIGAAVLMITMGLVEFGAYAVREARKAQRRERLIHDSQMDAMAWDWYWQAQNERIKLNTDLPAEINDWEV